MRINHKYKKPELLAPAGDLERLITALSYGADAVYIGGTGYGLRAGAKNFNSDEMAIGIEYAHAHGAKLYITANIFARNSDFSDAGGMADFFKEVYRLGADALIISDPGVFTLARETVPDMAVHISTQANSTNYRSARFWHGLGASRIIMARELSLAEIKDIRANTEPSLEIEAFVHGAMCVSYSGRCLLSGFMTNRDANRGECSQPCRYPYRLTEGSADAQFDIASALPNGINGANGTNGTNKDLEYTIAEDKNGTYILNSKDLCMIQHLPELMDAGISSLKIEGRMKSPYYVATTVRAYREAIDDYFESPAKYESKKNHYLSEVQKNSHRPFTSGFYFGTGGTQTQAYDSGGYLRDYDFVGVVLDYEPETGIAVVEQRNKFVKGEEIEFFGPKAGFTQIIGDMYDEDGAPVTEAPHPQQVLRIKVSEKVGKLYMLRRRRCV